MCLCECHDAVKEELLMTIKDEDSSYDELLEMRWKDYEDKWSLVEVLLWRLKEGQDQISMMVTQEKGS